MKNNGYNQKQYTQPVKRYCKTMMLKDDPQLIEKYIEAHDRLHAWPEIRRGIREVGILEMEIYIYSNRLFMIIVTSQNLDLEQAMKRLASLPRQAEWETFTAMFQDCDLEASSNEKWQLMDRIFYLYD
jgi:L-rhamnose mutarotase